MIANILSFVPQEILIPVVGSVVTALIGAVKAFKFIHEGEKGIKLRFGRAVRDEKGRPKIIEPGFVFLIPWVESLQRHHVRQQSFRFEDQRIMLKDGLIFIIGAMVVFRVIDIYKALFEIDNLDGSIDDMGMAALREVIQPLTHAELENIEGISKKLIDQVKEKYFEWGVELERFSITDCAPTPETANILNAKVGVQMRVSALKGVAVESLEILQRIDSTLAAALVGIPVAVSIGAREHKIQPVQASVKERNGVEVTVGA